MSGSVPSTEYLQVRGVVSNRLTQHAFTSLSAAMAGRRTAPLGKAATSMWPLVCRRRWCGGPLLRLSRRELGQ